MATCKVVIRPQAEKEFLAIPFPFRRQLNQLIFKLAADPLRPGTELVEGGLYRVRAHGWVLLFEVDEGEVELIVVAFRKDVR